MHEFCLTSCRLFDKKSKSGSRLSLLIFLLALAGASLQGCDKSTGIFGSGDSEEAGNCSSSDVGTLNCQCLGGEFGQCQPGLYCNNNVCLEPPRCDLPGTLNCLCDSNAPCGGDLECVSGICKPCGFEKVGCSCITDSDCGLDGMECSQNACKCSVGYRGLNCQFSNATTCNGNGVVDQAGDCTCRENRGGTTCNQCADGYNGSECQFSDATRCKSNGTVNITGDCACNPGWGGERCNECAAGYFGDQCASECPGGAVKPCSDNGECIKDTGVCDCNTGWAGSECNTCDTDYIEDPADTTACCKLGSAGCKCDADGTSVCNAGLLCSEEVCIAPKCMAGEEGCACRTPTAELAECDLKIEVGIEEPMYCSAGVCRSRSCEPGILGCLCIGGDTGLCLDNDVDCEHGICGGLTSVQDGEGSFLQNCRVATTDEATSDRCDWGFRCDHEPLDPKDHPGTCKPCDPGTQACQCRGGLSEEPCEAGLTCIPNDFGGRCEYTEWTTGLPCFSLCKDSSEYQNEAGVVIETITCGDDELAAACIYGPSECERGGCYTPEDRDDGIWNECEVDPDCPEYQRCLYDPGLMKKLCASNCGPQMPWACDSKSECASGVCRQKCTTDDLLECENSGDECEGTSTKDPESKDGYCFTQVPRDYQEESLSAVPTFHLSPESNDEFKLNSIEFREIPKSNPPRYRASFTLHNTAPWSQTFYVTKRVQTLPDSNGLLVSRSVPSQAMRRGTGAACRPGTLGCVPNQKGKCAPWVDSMYEEAGQPCTTDRFCDPTEESGLVCGEESKVCERENACVDKAQCDQNVSGINCLEGECRRTVATVKGSDGRCKLSEDGKNPGQSGNLLSFLRVGLDWNKDDPDDNNDDFSGSLNAVAYQEVTIEPGEKSPVELQFKSSDVCPATGDCKWLGDLEVSTVDGSKKNVVMSYNEGPKNVWIGSIVYFGSFPRPERWDGNGETATAPLSALDISDDLSSSNALLQAYTSFEVASNPGDEDISQLIVTFDVAKEDLWLTGEDCDNAVDGPCTSCRQSDSGVKCIGQVGGHMPSGPLEMPFIAYLDFSGSQSQKSHVITEGTLHYPGSPAIDLAIADITENRFRKLHKFKSFSILDGHYLIGDSAQSDCANDEVLVQVPWLAAIGADSVCDGSCSERVVKECRGTKYPFVDEGEKNKNFTLANPLKDGSRIQRKLEMIDGGVIDSERLILLFRETVSFEGTSDIKPAVSYGYLDLTRKSSEIDISERENYKKPTVEASTVDPYASRDWCGPALDKLEAAKPDIQRAQLENDNITKQAAQKIIMALYAGKEELSAYTIQLSLLCKGDPTSNNLCEEKNAGSTCGSGTCEYSTMTCTDNKDLKGCVGKAPGHSCGNGGACTEKNKLSVDDDWTVHYLCEDTGLFDEDCPVESKKTFFLKKFFGDDAHGGFNHNTEIACESSAPANDPNWRVQVKDYIKVQFNKLNLTASESCINHTDSGNNGESINQGCQDQNAPEMAAQVGATMSTSDGQQSFEIELDSKKKSLPQPAPCKTQLKDWLKNNSKNYRSALYECHTTQGCDQLDNPIGGKVFLQPVGEPALLSPLQGGNGLVNSAFSYVTKFQSSAAGASGGLAFVPEICPPIETTGYCYSPEMISEIAARNECLLYLYTKNPKGAFDGDYLDPVVKYINESLAYSSLGGGYGIVTIQSGFEKLYSEFLVMMGDDALTAALSARFDLAGVTIGDFPGEDFETDGIRLTGLAGGEMRNFYKATQYFQTALDRFQRNWLLISKIKKDDASRLTPIVTAKMATTYLDKVIDAAKKKAKAWSYIAKRYHNLESPKLARAVIERAYNAAFFENIFISSAIRTVLLATSGASRDELRSNLKKAQTGFKAALTNMETVNDSLGAELNYFGYPLDYIPFPGLEAGAGRDNGFEVQIFRAKDRLPWASAKENAAIESSRSIATDAASFFSELEQVENGLEAQLLEKCGSFTSDDGQVYPAILDYVDYLPDNLKAGGDPCGSTLMKSGSIYEAMMQYQLEALELKGSIRALEEKVEQVKNQVHHIETGCAMIKNFGQQLKKNALGKMTIQNNIAEANRGITAANQTYATASNIGSAIAATSVDSSNTTGGGNFKDALKGALKTGAIGLFQATRTQAAFTVHRAMENELKKLQEEQMSIKPNQACKMLTIEGEHQIKNILAGMETARIELAKAQRELALQAHRGDAERKEATRLLAELHEMKQLTINKAAARNNPNFRIYRDDNVRNAEFSFKKVLAETYKATKIYEYYTSKTYGGYSRLLEARMINYGENNLQNYLYDLEDAFWAFEDKFGVPELRVLPLSLQKNIFPGMRVSPEGKPYSKREMDDSVKEWISHSLSEGGVANISFRIGQEHISPNTRVHKISHVEACVKNPDVAAARHPRIYLKMDGTSHVWELGKSTIDQRYNFESRPSIVTARWCTGEDFSWDPKIFQSHKFTQRPLFNTNWELSINFTEEPANLNYTPQDFENLRLFFYYYEYTDF